MSDEHKSYIIYDGECPYCRNYVQLLKLQQTVGEVTLLNAREKNNVFVEEVKKKYDLNKGMIFYHNNQYHYSADAVHMMALMGSRSDFFNKMNKWIFESPSRSKILYPFLKFCRNLTLKILGKKPIS